MASLVASPLPASPPILSKGPLDLDEDYFSIKKGDSPSQKIKTSPNDQKEEKSPTLVFAAIDQKENEQFDWRKKKVVVLNQSQFHFKLKVPSLCKLNSLSNAVAGSSLCFMLDNKLSTSTHLKSAIDDGIARYHMAQKFSRTKTGDLNWPKVYHFAFKPELILYSPDDETLPESDNLLFTVPQSDCLKNYFYDLITYFMGMAEKFQNEKIGIILAVEDLRYAVTIKKNTAANEYEFEFCDTYGYSSQDNHSYLMRLDSKTEFLNFLSCEFQEDDDGIPIDQSKIGFFFLRKRPALQCFLC